ncbi:MAG TPA: sensor histidine kinase [Gaiellaceae bacterium]|nr:sensor histidine kinase [Gaiellaceae bacterium]
MSGVWPNARTAILLRLGKMSSTRREPSDERDAGLELSFRFAAVQVGYWLGWASIVVVLAGLTFDVGAQHRWLLIGSTLAAAAGNTVAMVIPWREWLGTRRGRVLLDLWCAGLIAFVALLVVSGGSNFSLLLFLAVPFIAVVQIGWRRGFWLAVVTGTCTVVAALIPLSAGATAMRLAVVAAAAAVALVLVRAIRREAAAHRRASARAELARTLAQEANHRIKNDLQTVADLLLLGRPDGTDGTAFDETAARIRSIATVHRLLTESGDRVDGGALLRSITAGAPVPVTVEAEPRAFDAVTAQRVGLVANELVTNAYQHGAPPIVVRLTGGAVSRLCVDDHGGGVERGNGFGLDLVQRMVEQGLGGSFELHERSGGGTSAEVVFPTGSR